MKDSMSTTDIACIMKELQVVVDCWVDNIYSFGKIFIFKLRSPKKGSFLLLVELGRRIHFTEYRRTSLHPPDNKTMALRKKIRGGKITEIFQHEFDRIVQIGISGKQEYQLVCELFGKGNLIVVDDKNRVIWALWYKKMRDRDLLPGKELVLPPSRGKLILSIDQEDFLSLQDQQNTELVRALARTFSGGGELVEELLARAELEKTMPVEEFLRAENKQEKLLNAIGSISKDLTELSPKVILDGDGELSNVLPFEYVSQKGDVEGKKSFSSALDAYFSSREDISFEEVTEKDKQLGKLNKVLESQQKHLERLQYNANEKKRLADLLYAHYQGVGELFETILRARNDNLPWEEIQEKLAIAKETGIGAANLVELISPAKAEIVLNLGGTIMTLDFRKTVQELAGEFYDASKKAEQKIKPAKEAIEDTLGKIEEAKARKQTAEIESKVRIKRRKRSWFERFHWTETRNGRLVIGGKNVKSNEEIAKKRMRKHDLFFHTDIAGAPYTVLFVEPSEEVDPQDIHEAATMAVVYSKAWKSGHGAADVYHVTGDQASFSAPSGEYIPKGGIMVRGKRNYIRGVPLQLAIGLIIEKEYARLICGTRDTVASRTSKFVLLKPGRTRKSEIAKTMKKRFLDDVTASERPKINALDINAFMEFIPGDADFVRLKQNK